MAQLDLKDPFYAYPPSLRRRSAESVEEAAIEESNRWLGFTAAVRTPAPAAGAAYAQLSSSGSTLLRLRSIGIVMAPTLVASDIGLIRTDSAGTPTTVVTGVPNQLFNASSIIAAGRISTAWSVAPTIAGTPVYLRRVSLPATGGSVEWIWDEDDLLEVGAGNGEGLLVWNFGTGAAANMDLYANWQQRDTSI